MSAACSLRCTECAVEFVPVPAITVPVPPAASTAARSRSPRSSSVSVGLSPVVPATTMPSEPWSSRWRASDWNPSKSIDESLRNGVTIAVSTRPSIVGILLRRQVATHLRDTGRDQHGTRGLEKRVLVWTAGKADERLRRELPEPLRERLDVAPLVEHVGGEREIEAFVPCVPPVAHLRSQLDPVASRVLLKQVDRIDRPIRRRHERAARRRDERR